MLFGAEVIKYEAEKENNRETPAEKQSESLYGCG